MNLQELWSKLPEGPRKKPPPYRLLAIDPGETTGVSVFSGFALIHAEQLNTSDMRNAPSIMRDWIEKWGKYGDVQDLKPAQVVMEDYRVYSHKTVQHTWAALHTPRFIGSIEAICQFSRPRIPYVKQMAQVAKGFCTDNKLKEWGFYNRGQNHARDSMRHAAYYILWPSQPAIRDQ